MSQSFGKPCLIAWSMVVVIHWLVSGLVHFKISIVIKVASTTFPLEILFASLLTFSIDTHMVFPCQVLMSWSLFHCAYKDYVHIGSYLCYWISQLYLPFYHWVVFMLPLGWVKIKHLMSTYTYPDILIAHSRMTLIDSFLFLFTSLLRGRFMT